MNLSDLASLPNVSVIHITSLVPAGASCDVAKPRLIDTRPEIEAERNRCIAQVWVVSETEEDGDQVRHLAVLDTMHMPNRGGYVTSLRPMTERQTPGFRPVRSFMMMEYLPIHTTPCGRYSAKGLANAAAAAFAALRARKDDPAVRAIFGEVDGE